MVSNLQLQLEAFHYAYARQEINEIRVKAKRGMDAAAVSSALSGPCGTAQPA
jgi:hypothetical protein